MHSKNSPVSIKVWNIFTKVVPWQLVYEVQLNDANLHFQAPVLTKLASLIMLCIFEMFYTGHIAGQSKNKCYSLIHQHGKKTC